MSRKAIYIVLGSLGFLILLFAGYARWNSANPERTCASCHEIVPSMESWRLSAHRDVSCAGCHGTALSNGFHSLTEKAGMVLSHFRGGQEVEDIALDEKGVLEVTGACIECHRSVYSKWQSGGHSATYADIFLDTEHNHMEQLYPDCFRCHGMFYDGTISELVEPISTRGPWSLKDPAMADRPAIPCLSCHGIHVENETRPPAEALDDPESLFYRRTGRNPAAGLYLRSDEMFLRADYLPEPVIYHGDSVVMVPDDPLQRVCVQCHAPNWAHQAGSEDDRTPLGVHEGISCMACHPAHSNDARNSCSSCHPALSNCGLDVKTMNTTYAFRDSPNNIHFVACTDCHQIVPRSMQEVLKR